MISSAIHVRQMCAITALILMTASPFAMALARSETAAPAKTAALEPSAYEKTKAATKKAAKATARAGGEVVDGTKRVAGKAGTAVTGLGEKLDSKVPRTEAYKKQQVKAKARPQASQTTN